MCTQGTKCVDKGKSQIKMTRAELHAESVGVIFAINNWQNNVCTMLWYQGTKCVDKGKSQIKMTRAELHAESVCKVLSF
jgi:hypothetical protein